MNLKKKIDNAVKNNKLNPEILGERNWYSYFIRTTELVRERNNYEGYQIEVYREKYGDHLGTFLV